LAPRTTFKQIARLTPFVVSCSCLDQHFNPDIQIYCKIKDFNPEAHFGPHINKINMFSALRTLSSVRAAPIIARRTYATEIPIGQVARVYRMNVNDEATAMKVDAMMAEVRPIILASLTMCQAELPVRWCRRIAAIHPCLSVFSQRVRYSQ
jgi:hypothetical protein